MFGIAITTYMTDRIDLSERHKVFDTCIQSLLESGFPGLIVIVDDGSTNKDHLKNLDLNQRIEELHIRKMLEFVICTKMVVNTYSIQMMMLNS